MFWYILIGVVVVVLFVVFFGNNKSKFKQTNNKEEVDQDLQDLAYMDDLLNLKNKKDINNIQNNSSRKCPFCNNPYYECTCEHSGENKEKISQRFIDEE